MAHFLTFLLIPLVFALPFAELAQQGTCGRRVFASCASCKPWSTPGAEACGAAAAARQRRFHRGERDRNERQTRERGKRIETERPWSGRLRPKVGDTKACQRSRCHKRPALRGALSPAGWDALAQRPASAGVHAPLDGRLRQRRGLLRDPGPKRPKCPKHGAFGPLHPADPAQRAGICLLHDDGSASAAARAGGSGGDAARAIRSREYIKKRSLPGPSLWFVL